MSEMTITREAPRRRTATYRLVETLLRQNLNQPKVTLEAWVIAQRNLGVAWRPMVPKLHEAAGLDRVGVDVGYEALRRWFGYLAPVDADEADEAGAARTD
jgi:hypothetical protein